ncbi:MAG TPA: Rrf2 family transcriptional regulator [Firmicutes bacterium]|nr:Rrf2 family transcriptional regulator [Bacillota bacterium]
MQLNLETDYAIRLVSILCESKERISASEIARRTGVTLRFSLKILGKLAQSGIVKSYKGANGGYVVNKAPKDISLREVVTVMQGPIEINKCTKSDELCTNPNSAECRFRAFFAQLSKEINDKMEKMRFA